MNEKQFVYDIYNQLITISDYAEAVKQCQLCADSPFIMDKKVNGRRITVGEYNKYLLDKLSK